MSLPSKITSIRLGTRASTLALIQAEMAKAALIIAYPELEEPGRITVVPMSTSGDRNKQVPLYDIGGKGLFTKEIEEGLLGRTIDIAVHSLKDIPGYLPEGLVLAAMLPREDPRDTLLAVAADSIATLPRNGTFGTSSPRRAAQVKRQRPDLRVQPLRGNVPTRVAKVQQGECDGTLLAIAGLKRLGMADIVHTPLSVEQMLPAIGQGTIALECRQEDEALLELLHGVSHTKTAIEMTAERTLLATLDGSCRTPIAGYAYSKGSNLHIRGLVASFGGEVCFTAERRGPVSSAAQLGREVAEELMKLGGLELIRQGE